MFARKGPFGPFFGVMTRSCSKMLAQDLQGHRRNTQSPEDVVRMLLLAAPDAGRPPPEIVGAALKAAGVPINDQNLIRALEEAAGARGGNPSREDVVRARSGAHEYKVAPRPDSDGGSSGSEDSARPREPRQQEIKPQTAVASITFNSALAQMNKKPIQAMRVLESMRVSMPDVAALQRMDQLRNGGSFTLPKEPEEVVRTLCQVAPDAGRPPPEVVGAALKAAGLPATEENLEKALHEALGHRPSSEDMTLARTAAAQYSGGTSPGGYGVEPGGGSSSSSKPKVRQPPSRGPQPEEIIEALLRAAPGLGQPPPEVVGLALRQAGVAICEDTVRRALRAAGDHAPSTNALRMALAAGQDDE